MSKMQLAIVATVQNQASTPLKNIEKAVRQTGVAIKKSTDDIFAFNRAAFHASLFLNNYLRSIKGLSQDIEEGARLDRLTTQYERVLGPSGELFVQIRKFTDASIDQMEAMRAGIALKTLGIAASTAQVAEMVSMAGVAAKQAGLDSGEGIKKFTQFLKTGNLELIESLNLIRTGDPVLKTQLQLLGKYGGVMSSALTVQEKFTIGMTALRRATQGNMKGNRDLLDTVLDLKQNWKMFTSEIGIVIGRALQPLLEKFIDIMQQTKVVLAQLRTMDQGFLFLVKSIIVTTTAISGLVAVLGALKLTVKGLGAVGFGLPKIIGLVGLLGLTFATITSKVDKAGEAFSKGPFGKIIEKVRVFGAVIRGVFEAVTSAFDPENEAKGIGKISGSVAKLLEQYGLIETQMIDGRKVITGGLVQNLSKFFYIVSKFAVDVKTTLVGWFDWVMNKVGMITGLFNKLGSVKTRLIPRSWLDDLDGLRGALVKTAAAMLILSRFGFLKGLLGKIPVIGKLFGGGKGPGSGPRGTASDPLYVIQKDSIKSASSLASIKNIPGMGLLAESVARVRKTLLGLFGGLSMMGTSIRTFGFAAGDIGAVFKGIISAGRALTAEFVIWQVLFTGLQGFIKGFDFDSVGTFFKGLKDQFKSISFEDIATPLKKFATTVEGIVEGLLAWIKKIPVLGSVVERIQSTFNAIGQGWEVIGGMTSHGLTAAGEGMSSNALQRNINKGIAGKQVQMKSEDLGTSPAMAATKLISELDAMQQTARASTARKALSSAMGVNTEGGTNVTESEFQKILQAAFTNAMNKADFTTAAKKIEGNTKPKIDKPSTMNRGGC